MTIVTLISRPGDITYDPDTLAVVSHTAPADWQTGDQNSSTFLAPFFAPGTSHGAYGIIEFTAEALGDVTRSEWDGTDMLDDAPPGAVIVAQRGFVSYTSDYEVGWSMEDGDGPSIYIIGGEPAGSVTSTSSITTPFMTNRARLFIAVEDDDHDTYSVAVTEWWIETDYLLADPPDVDVAAFAGMPPLRIHPRDDTLGTSSHARLYPPPSSTQASNRLAGGYL